MDKDRLDRMTNGWFIGDFEPSVFRTTEFEVGVKRYPTGMVEPAHQHLIATEVTLVLSGKVRMNQIFYFPGDILVTHPGEQVSFEAIEDSVTVVVKTPSVIGDKYVVQE